MAPVILVGEEIPELSKDELLKDLSGTGRNLIVIEQYESILIFKLIAMSEQCYKDMKHFFYYNKLSNLES